MAKIPLENIKLGANVNENAWEGKKGRLPA